MTMLHELKSFLKEDGILVSPQRYPSEDKNRIKTKIINLRKWRISATRLDQIISRDPSRGSKPNLERLALRCPTNRITENSTGLTFDQKSKLSLA